MPVGISIVIFLSTLFLGGYGITHVISLFSPLEERERFLFSFPVGPSFLGLIEYVANSFGGIPITSGFVYGISLSFASFGLFLIIRTLNKGFLKYVKLHSDTVKHVFRHVSDCWVICLSLPNFPSVSYSNSVGSVQPSMHPCTFTIHTSSMCTFAYRGIIFVHPSRRLQFKLGWVG